MLMRLASRAQGAVAVEGEAVLWHPTANRPPWGSDSGLGDGPDAAGADSDGAEPGGWYDDEPNASAAAAVAGPSPAAATSRGSTQDEQPGVGVAGEDGRHHGSGEAEAGSDGSESGVSEVGPSERGGGGESGADAAEQGPASAAEAVDARRLPHDWLVTIGADGAATAEPGPGSSGREASGAGDAAGARSARAGSKPEDRASGSGGALRGGFLPDAHPRGSGAASSSAAGGPSPVAGPAGRHGNEAAAAAHAGGPSAGEPKELHPEVAAKLDAALAQIGVAREALGEGPLLAGISASGIQSGAPPFRRVQSSAAPAVMT